jgi:metallo-beta-lactamase family protein
MKFTFLGAARSVTGSCHLIETNGLKILVDCGMRQGKDAKQELGAGELPFAARDIDFMLLTHAHIDHSGLIPVLVKEGFTGRVICTSATADLVEIMLVDSGHIQELEAQWKTKKRARTSQPPVAPLYTAEEAKAVAKYITVLDYDKTYDLNDKVRIRFKDAGHLFGSSFIEVFAMEDGKEIKTVFSGDIGNKSKPILNDPSVIESADYIVMESTYGDRNHEDTRPSKDQLRDILTKAIQRGGNIVIPSFAVGRTQDILYEISVLLKEGSVPGLDKTPVYLDSPLAIQATQIFKKQYAKYFDEEALEYMKEGVDFFGFKTLHIAQSAEDSKAINDMPYQKIILSASGMCEAGRIKHHLKHNLWRADSTILFVGYQAEGTLGRVILDGEKKVKVFGEPIHVNADIQMIEGFSGHADKDGLIEWVQHFKTHIQKIFLVHGEEKTMMSFMRDLQALGFDVIAPRLRDTYDTHSAALQAAPQAEKPSIVEVIRRTLERVAAAVDTEIGKDNQQKLLPMEDDLMDFLAKWGNHTGKQ